MSDPKKDGFDDARNGKDPNPPKADFLDYIGLGLSDNHIKENIEAYEKGYDLGTQQRLADKS